MFIWYYALSINSFCSLLFFYPQFTHESLKTVIALDEKRFGQKENTAADTAVEEKKRRQPNEKHQQYRLVRWP